MTSKTIIFLKKADPAPLLTCAQILFVERTFVN